MQTTSLGTPNYQQMSSSYPFPLHYSNQNFPTQLNFIDFPHFHNQSPQIPSNPSSQLLPFPSSQNPSCKQEDQLNSPLMTLQPTHTTQNPLENIKKEPFIQTKYENGSIHDPSFCTQYLPVKLEIKKESDSPSSPILPQSKKIKKKFLDSQTNRHKSYSQRSPIKKTRRTWSPEEDAQLLELIKKHGTKWAKIASHMQSRNGKQVRDHYLNALAPDINRGIWTDEEDNAILSYYNKYGAQWCRIAECLSGRTETQVKGRFYTNLKQKITMMKNVKVEIIIDEFIKEEDEL